MRHRNVLAAAGKEKYRSDATHAFISTKTGQAELLRGFNVRTTAVASNWALARWQAWMARAATAGAARNFDHCRLAVCWRDIEATQGVYTWSNMDAQIDNAISVGLNIILDPMHTANSGGGGITPDWISKGTADDTIRDLIADTGPDHNYGLEYWRAVLNRYGHIPEIIALDIINEPLYGGAAAPGFVDNKKLFQMFAAVIPELRKINQDKILITTCISGGTALPSTTQDLHTHAGSDYSSLRLNWASDFPASVRHNVVNTFHLYYGGGGTGPGGSPGVVNNGFSSSGYVNGNDLGGGADFNNTNQDIASQLAQYKAWCDEPGLPLYIGEHGIFGAATHRLGWIDEVVSWCNANGVSRTWWEIATGDNPPELNLNVFNTSTWSDDRLTHILA